MNEMGSPRQSSRLCTRRRRTLLLTRGAGVLPPPLDETCTCRSMPAVTLSRQEAMLGRMNSVGGVRSRSEDLPGLPCPRSKPAPRKGQLDHLGDFHQERGFARRVRAPRAVRGTPARYRGEGARQPRRSLPTGPPFPGHQDPARHRRTMSATEDASPIHSARALISPDGGEGAPLRPGAPLPAPPVLFARKALRQD